MIQKSLHIFAFQYSKQTDENGTTLDYQYCGPAQRNKQTLKLQCSLISCHIIDYVAFKMKSEAMLNLMMQVGDLSGEADNEQKRLPLRLALNESGEIKPAVKQKLSLVCFSGDFNL